ncbi:MAG: peptidylprolyl isomerase [Planctomycetota bacterium]
MIDPETADLAQVEACISTDLGDLVVAFRPDKAPAHVANFVRLAASGFFDGLAFHRVVRNFVVQAGCPNSREGSTGIPGTGGPGWKVHAEFNDLPHQRGALSMARGQDPNSAGSQFFLVQAESLPSLDGRYTVFGQLRDGFEVLDAIAAVECTIGPGGERSVPKDRLAIRSVTLREAQPLPVEAAEAAQATPTSEEDSDQEHS